MSGISPEADAVDDLGDLTVDQLSRLRQRPELKSI